MNAQTTGESEMRDLEHRLRNWAHEMVPTTPVPELVSATMSRVGTTRQRPTLLVRPLVHRDPLPRASWLVPALTVLLALILALATAIAAARLLLHDQSPPMGNGGIVVLIGNTAYLVASDGWSRTALPIPLNAYSCPTYSPDGQHIAYISDPSHEGTGPQTLAVAAADGFAPRALWTGTFANDFRQVVWSRDSSRVYVNGAMTSAGLGVGSVIGNVPAGSAELIAPLGADTPGEVSFNGVDPTEIAFSSGGGSLLQVIDTDDGSVRTVATEGGMHSVSWAPDGTTIAYTANSAQYATERDLYFVNSDGSNLRDVSAGSVGSEGLLAWSPDGRLLAVKVEGASPDGTFVMALFDQQGRAAGTLGPFAVSSNFSFTWSPDSKELLLGLGGTGIGAGHNGPLIAPIDGGPARSIGVAPGEYYLQCPLSWQPVN